ncbi:MAG: TRAM domain-containing protein [Candidatus Micrarchaeota archaeon]
MGEEKRFGIPKPVDVGQTVEVLIEGQGGQGDGIAKIESFVVFVKGARKGERCMVKITDVKRTYATGEKVGAAPKKESADEMSDETDGFHDGPAG